MPRITIIGAGNVGSAAAIYLSEEALGEIVLLDLVEGLAAGKALDLAAALPARRRNLPLRGASDFAEMSGSALVVVTAGFPRQPGMSRLDLLDRNAAVIKEVSAKVARYAPQAFLLNVTNPLDAMCYLAQKVTRFPPPRVLGMAGLLDTARFRIFVARELGLGVEEVSAMVLGGHGEEMVPLVSSATVSGLPLRRLMSEEAVARIVERTRNAGAEVVGLLKTGSASISPGAAVAVMARAILNDEQRLLPAACYLQGEYGYRGIYLGVPAVLGAKGVERVVEVELAEPEKQALQLSARAVQESIAQLEARQG